MLEIKRIELWDIAFEMPDDFDLIFFKGYPFRVEWLEVRSLNSDTARLFKQAHVSAGIDFKKYDDIEVRFTVGIHGERAQAVMASCGQKGTRKASRIETKVKQGRQNEYWHRWYRQNISDNDRNDHRGRNSSAWHTRWGRSGHVAKTESRKMNRKKN